MIEFFTLLSGAITFFTILKNIKNIKFIFWGFTILLVLFDGLRWQMGTDWPSYFAIFERAIDGHSEPGMEIGFVLYTNLISNFTNNYSVYLLITTAIIYIGIFYTVFKLTNHCFMSIFYLTGTLSWYSGSLRQMLASVFFILALKSIMDKKPIHFMALMAIGATFHTTMIVMLPIYWLYGMSTAVFIFVFLFIIFGSYFSRNFIVLLDAILSLYSDRSYSERIGGTYDLSTPVLGFARKIFTQIGFIYFSIEAKPSRTMDKLQLGKVKFLLMLLSFSIVLYYIGTFHISHVSSRLDIYISIISTSVLIGILDKALNRNKRLILFIFVVSMVYIFYSRLQFMELFHPYSSIFYNYDLNRSFDVELH